MFRAGTPIAPLNTGTARSATTPVTFCAGAPIVPLNTGTARSTTTPVRFCAGAAIAPLSTGTARFAAMTSTLPTNSEDQTSQQKEFTCNILQTIAPGYEPTGHTRPLETLIRQESVKNSDHEHENPRYVC